jgi:hypothetical protein
MALRTVTKCFCALCLFVGWPGPNDEIGMALFFSVFGVGEGKREIKKFGMQER